MEAKDVLLWLPMIGLAFLNAALRELVLRKYFSELRANQLSTLTLMILCSVYGLMIFSLLNIPDAGRALLVGMVWMVLTICFEFALGKFMKQSWAQLFEQYNLKRGQLWPVFLMYILLLPFLLYLVHG